jgi:hypothetical protein
MHCHPPAAIAAWLWLLIAAAALTHPQILAVVPKSHLLCSDGVGLTSLDGGAAQGGHSWNHLGAADPNDPSVLAPWLAERKLTTPLRQGSVALVHYDTIHRGTARAFDELTEQAPFRPMFKFNFLRTSEPKAASWNHDPAACAALPPFADLAGAEVCARQGHIITWLCS